MADDKQLALSPKVAAGGRRTPMVGESDRWTDVTADADDKKLAPQEQTSGKRRR